jgi:hypothetical protein
VRDAKPCRRRVASITVVAFDEPCVWFVLQLAPNG